MRELFPKLQFPNKNDPKIWLVVQFHRIAARTCHHLCLRHKWRTLIDSGIQGPGFKPRSHGSDNILPAQCNPHSFLSEFLGMLANFIL